MVLTRFLFVLLSFAASLALALPSVKTPCNVYFNRKYLDCSEQKLDGLPSQGMWNAYKNIYSEFETANFTNNQIKYVYPFPELDLKTLDLSNNIIEQVDQNCCSKLKRIESIDFSHNRIENSGFMKSRIENVIPVDTIPQRALMNYEDPEDNINPLLEPLLFLRTLNLGSNKLSSFNPNAFEFCANLEILNLEHNSFGVIDTDTDFAIRSLEKLKELYLNGNHLKTIPNYMLLNLMSLHILNLAYNNIAYIPSALVGTHIRNLSFDGNPIVRLTRQNIFPMMTKLETLSMCYMPHFSEVGDGAFANLKGLKTLFISNNPMFTKLSANAFWSGIRANNIIKLDKLWLNNNSLTVVPEELLDNWESLKEINLQHNNWVCSVNNFLIEELTPLIKRKTPYLVSGLSCKDESGVMVKIDKIVQQNSSNSKVESKASFIHNSSYMLLLAFAIYFYL